MSDERFDLPSDLQPVDEALRSARPQVSAVELDDLKRRVRGRVSPPASPRGFARTRLAITAALVAGLLMSGTGGALAITGISGSGGNASVSQYQPGGNQPGNQPGNVPGNVLGNTRTGSQNNNGNTLGAGPQTARQLQATTSGGGGLPFTGLAAIPLLAIGLGLIVGGLVMRRRSHPHRA